MYEGDQQNFDAPPPEENNNRTFFTAVGILGGIVLISLACLAAFYFFSVRPNQGANSANATAQAIQNAQVAQALTSTAQAQSFPTATVTPTATPLVAQGTATATVTALNFDPITATVGAALTQAALAQLTVVPTMSALPQTGIADEYGAPGLIIIGAALIAVIFLVRRLRVVPVKK
ncbi:MAG: hypothetical protein HYX49_10610 [Chloroflexi bacterium]|nr:hypothetical protein [Chloroflexota bacterium]